MDELECFAAVVAEQGFSAAAARLGTTTAAVSRRIKALEQRLGVRLRQRTTRRVQLTEAGETYYREVHRLLQDLQAVEQQLQEVTRQPTGELRIVAPMSFGQRRLAPALAGFAAAHPKLRINLKLEDRETDIVAESFDVALRIAYPADSSYVARPIGPVPRYFCASPDYLAHRGTPFLSANSTRGLHRAGLPCEQPVLFGSWPTLALHLDRSLLSHSYSYASASDRPICFARANQDSESR